MINRARASEQSQDDISSLLKFKRLRWLRLEFFAERRYQGDLEIR